MKKVLLSFLLLAAFGLYAKLNAQCTISDVHITPKSINTTTCQVTVDLDYTVALNGGSKHTIIHLWEASQYPNPAHVASDYPLATAQTATMLGTIVINYQNSSPELLSSWPTGSGEFKSNTIPSTPILTPGFTVKTVGSSSIVKFTNLVLALSDCSVPTTIKGDVWATQNDQNASCLAAGSISVVANDPLMAGLLRCSAPRSFNVSFKTLGATSITFSAYKDANGNGAFDAVDQAAGKLNLSGPGIVGTATDVTINNPANVMTTYGYYTYDQQTPGSGFSVFVVARASGNNYDNVLRVDNTCSLLPVSFKSFSAARNNQTIALKWETAFEQNSKGFYVQRNVNGEWKDVAFVFSRADGGNSEQALSYSYNDPNNLKGASYYRIQQVDNDSKARFSDTRVVRGEEQISKLMLFPNPGTSGKINVLFGDETSAKDIIVYDATGRVVKSYKSVVSNDLTIDHLKVGIYSIQVKDLSSQTVSTDKFIIQN
jgi:Secretion system C-terminal sorting domain